jgi:AraC family transcriptional regulator
MDNKAEYIARINRVIDYIESNPCADLQLDDLARIAAFSTFHFHRIFRAITGEALHSFIQRFRLEKAAGQLAVNPQMTITKIAYDCGFGSSATFSRAFQQYFSTSPRQWRKTLLEKKSKIGKDRHVISEYIQRKAHDVHKRFAVAGDDPHLKMPDVVIKEIPPISLAYVRYIGPFIGNPDLYRSLSKKLLDWARPLNLVHFPAKKIIAVYHGNLGLADESRHRISLSIQVPADTRTAGEIGKMTLPKGKYAIAHFELPLEEMLYAWLSIYRDWLPQSGYQPDDGPIYEIYQTFPHEHPENRMAFDIRIPIKPL